MPIVHNKKIRLALDEIPDIFDFTPHQLLRGFSSVRLSIEARRPPPQATCQLMDV